MRQLNPIFHLLGVTATIKYRSTTCDEWGSGEWKRERNSCIFECVVKCQHSGNRCNHIQHSETKSYCCSYASLQIFIQTRLFCAWVICSVLRMLCVLVWYERNIACAWKDWKCHAKSFSTKKQKSRVVNRQPISVNIRGNPKKVQICEFMCVWHLNIWRHRFAWTREQWKWQSSMPTMDLFGKTLHERTERQKWKIYFQRSP